MASALWRNQVFVAVVSDGERVGRNVETPDVVRYATWVELQWYRHDASFKYNSSLLDLKLFRLRWLEAFAFRLLHDP